MSLPPGVPKGLPDCLKKRRLLNDPERLEPLCREYGEKFLALGWWEDALDFFQKGRAQGLEKIKDHCLETGDASLLGRLGQGSRPEDLAHTGGAGPGPGEVPLCPAGL